MSRRGKEMLGAAGVAALGFALIFTVLGLSLWLGSTAARSHENCGYVTRSKPYYDTWTGQVVTHYYQVPRPCYRRNHTYYLPEDRPRTRVYSYERRRDRDDDREYGGGIECRSPVSVTGDDKLDQDKAEISAQERWSLRVESQVGGIYSDIRYAARIKMACIRKVPGSVTERGQAVLGVRHFLCDLQATPCKAPAIRQDDETRAKRRSERIEEERAAPAPRRDR